MNVVPLPHAHLITLTLDVDIPNAARIGHLPHGHRSIAPISGGSFIGEQLIGTVLPGGSDWVLTRADRTMLIDVRLILKTEDATLIYLTYQGRFIGDETALTDLAAGRTLDASRYSLAMTARFECGAERYRWLNSVIAVGIGQQNGFNPTYEIFRIG